MNLSEYVGREDEIEHTEQVKGGKDWEVLGIVHCPEGNGVCSKIVVAFADGSAGHYSLDGRSYKTSVPHFRLKPKTREIDIWLNVYPGIHYLTKDQAVSQKRDDCIATINIKRTVTEGQIDEENL